MNYRVSRKTLSTFVSAISRFRKHRHKKFWTFSNSPFRRQFQIVQDHFIWVIIDWDIHRILRKTQNEKSHFDGRRLSAIKVNLRMLWGIFFSLKKNHIHGVAVAQGVLLHESEAKDEEFQEGCVITRCQTKPMVMELLDGIFQDIMLAMECLRGKTWASSYPVTCDS